MTTTRRQALEMFLARDPDDAFTRYALALELISAGERMAGLAQLRETVERDPEYIPAWHQLGQALTADGDTAAAESAYRRGIDVAQRTGDRHAAGEMQQELDELLDQA